MHHAVVFDDSPPALAPLVDLRASFEIRTGALTTIERHASMLSRRGLRLAAIHVHPDLAPLTREQIAPDLALAQLPSNGEALLLNGGCPLPPDEAFDLAPGSALRDPGTARIIAARLSASDARAFLDARALPSAAVVRDHHQPCLIDQPWDVIRFRDAALDADLRHLRPRETQRPPAAVTAINENDIHLSASASIFPTTVLDADKGPIVIDDHAVVRPGAIIIGPAYIGPRSTVLDRTLIKQHTAIGPVCKVAGEIGGTIFQGFANKAHDGHLGDSWVGCWANLGAGTTNSNLLNTYAHVIAQAAPDATRQRTGLQFLGVIVADHVKTAILTRIMTGSVFGTGSMIAALTPPTVVGRLEWLTDDPGRGVKRQPYRLDKFLDVARAAMARRNITPSDAYERRLASLERSPSHAGATSHSGAA